MLKMVIFYILQHKRKWILYVYIKYVEKEEARLNVAIEYFRMWPHCDAGV